MSYFRKRLEDEPKLYKERIPEIEKLEECYKKLSGVLAQTYGVPPPDVIFSWKYEMDLKVKASYSSKYRVILVTYRTLPDELAHEFKHYLQDIVERRSYNKEFEVISKGKRWSRKLHRMHPMEMEATEFEIKYGILIEEEGKKIYGSSVWVATLLRDKFKEGEIPDFVIDVFRRKVE